MTTDDTAPAPAPALKEIFNPARFRHVAKEALAVYPPFDSKAFLAQALDGLDDLSLMQRLRRMSESLHGVLPARYPRALSVLRKLAPRLDRGFVTLALPDYVGRYGRDDFDASMDALKFFTAFGSSEFAVREFLRLDPERALATMAGWAQDDSEHVRRLASEGSRPRLPWSFRLETLMADPELAAPILHRLKADPSPYVRKSVANHLNDVTRLHPDWVMQTLENWPLGDAATAWIARHALRTLIKRGDRRALAVIGAGDKARAEIDGLRLDPQRIRLGERLQLSFLLKSTARKTGTSQRLVVDYTIHYVKKSGASSAKVFKLKELTLAAGESMAISRGQLIRDFTTRVHHAGRHEVDVMVNGEKLASGFFDLVS